MILITKHFDYLNGPLMEKQQTDIQTGKAASQQSQLHLGSFSSNKIAKIRPIKSFQVKQRYLDLLKIEENLCDPRKPLVLR